MIVLVCLLRPLRTTLIVCGYIKNTLYFVCCRYLRVRTGAGCRAQRGSARLYRWGYGWPRNAGPTGAAVGPTVLHFETYVVPRRDTPVNIFVYEVEKLMKNISLQRLLSTVVKMGFRVKKCMTLTRLCL